MATAPDLNKASEIRACYENSMSFVAQALSEDEKQNVNLATEYYMNALRFLEDGLRIDITQREFSGESWRTSHQQQQKMLQAHIQVKQRLYSLQEEGGCASDLPNYSSRLPEGHTSLSNTLGSSQDLSNATVLLLIPSGIQMYFVSSDEHVGTTPPSYPTSLRVVVVEDAGVSQAFLNVGDWVYPLIKGQTPTLKMSNGAYVFPNCTEDGISRGSAIGIVISTQVDPSLVETFENILENLSLFRQQETDEDVINLSDSIDIEEREEPSVSDQIAYGLEKGAEWVSYGMSKGAAFATGMVKKGSDKIKENLTPEAEAAPVHPNVQKGLYYTHEATKATVQVSKFLVNGICAVTKKVSEQLAPHIKEYSDKILPKSVTEKSEDGSSTMDGVIKVAGAGLVGFGTIWTELERSGLAIARSVSSATVENVQFKYGPEAGQATNHAMRSVVNVGKTAFNLDNLGFKAIAKRTAKDTGKAIMKEYSYDATKEKLKEEEAVNSEQIKK